MSRYLALARSLLMAAYIAVLIAWWRWARRELLSMRPGDEGLREIALRLSELEARLLTFTFTFKKRSH